MNTPAPTFDDFVRPLLGDAGVPATDGTPLSQLPAGDYAVLAWLDDVRESLPPGVEADLVARWSTASLRDVYAMIFADMTFTDADPPGAESS